MSNKRYYRFIIVSFVIMAIFFCAFTKRIEHDHDCNGYNCIICMQLETCRNIYKPVDCLWVVSEILLLIIPYKFCLHKQVSCFSKSLVALKIKLTN